MKWLKTSIFSGTIDLLFILYFLSLGLIDIIELPTVGKKIQLPEIIFLLLTISLIPSIFKSWRKILFPIRSPISTAIFFYLIAFSFSVIVNQNHKSFLELIGLLYLICVFVLFRSFLINTIKSHYSILNKLLEYLGVFIAITGIIGWILVQFDINTSLAFAKTTYYPYFGYIGRAKGSFPTPALFTNILGALFLFKIGTILITKNFIRKDLITLFIMLLGLILSFSKSCVLILICLLWALKKTDLLPKFTRVFVYPTILILFLFFNLATHLLIVSPDSIAEKPILRDNTYISQKPIVENDNFWVVKTNYLLMKQSNLIAFYRNPIFGLGPGGHNEFIFNLGQEKEYLEDYEGESSDPHSTYFGAFSELGLVGGIALIFLVFTLYKGIVKLSYDKSVPKRITLPLQLIFLYFLMEGVNHDMMNFRHLWVFLALLDAFIFLKWDTK
jgi:O-antigen ligase